MRRPLGTDVPGRVRGRTAQPGRHDPLRGTQRAPGRPRRAHLQRVAGPRRVDARAQGPAVHRGQPPPRPCLRRLRAELLHRARLHQHAHRPGPRGHPAERRGPHRRRPDRAGRRPRRVQPRADRRVHRLRGHRRRRAGRPGDHRDHPWLEGRGPPRWPRRGAVPAREDRRRLRPGLLRRRVPPGRAHRPCRAHQVGRAVAGVQAHRDGPRRVAVPEAAPRAPRRDRPRADVRRDLPRLHPRLPFLPGRHDHAPRAGAKHHRHRRDGREGSQGDRLRRGRAARSPPRTTPRSARSPRASPTGTPRTRSASRCPPPASTRSTWTWPTS